MAAIQKGRALQSRRRSGGQSKCWLAFGETDNGGPRLRKQYSPNYYAAFVLDPDGNIKGVYRGAQASWPGAGAVRLCESINALVRSIRLATSFHQLLREASSVGGGRRSLDHTSPSALLRR